MTFVEKTLSRHLDDEVHHLESDEANAEHLVCFLVPIS